MVRDYGMAYQENHGGWDRELLCPVCHEYGRGVAAESVLYNQHRVKNIRASIRRHLATYVQRKALARKEKERTRHLRRVRVGLMIARTTLHMVREGNNYIQFEKKLQSLHMASLDIGSLNY